MRSLLAASLLAAATFAACSQPLADRPGTGGGTGTGGDMTGTGGAGAGAVSGTGGTPVTCDSLASQYAAEVQAAQSCTIGAPDPCQQLLTPTVDGCSCSVPASTPVPNAIKQTWLAAGCAAITSAPSCAALPCRSSGYAVCVQNPLTPGGATGICAIVPSGTGGSDGGGFPDGGFDYCNQLSDKYAASLTAAMTCDVGASGQCAQKVASSLSVCGSCPTLVNDATELNQIRDAWTQAGCDRAVAVACPAIGCVAPDTANCLAADGGGGTCVLDYGGPPLLR